MRFGAEISLVYAASFWGVVWYPLRLLEQAGLNGLWQALVSYLAALLLVLPFYRRYRQDLSAGGWSLLLMALVAGWTNIAFMLAMLEGNVLRVLLLFYLSPVWTVLLGALVLGEAITQRSALVIGVAMLGAFFMLWEPGMGWPWPRDTADWLALSAGAAFATTNVLVRHLQQVSVPCKMLGSWIGVLLIALVGLGWWGDQSLPQATTAAWGGAALLGILGFLAATFAVQYGVTRMPVQRSAVILLFELVAGGISAAILTDEHIRDVEWLGGSLIVLAGYWAARANLAEPERASV